MTALISAAACPSVMSLIATCTDLSRKSGFRVVNTTRDLGQRATNSDASCTFVEAKSVRSSSPSITMSTPHSNTVAEPISRLTRASIVSFNSLAEMNIGTGARLSF